MKREKVSPKEWRERLDRAVNAKRGRWRVLPRAVASSRAFAELSKSGLIVVLAMLDNLAYQWKSKRKGSGGLQCCGLALENNGEFVITNNELIARGLKSPDSISRGRTEAWELGFYDVVKTGSLMNYGIYRYSERWKNFPDGDHLPCDQPKPGKCLSPTQKQKLKPTTESVVSTTTESVVREDDGVTTENVVIETDFPTTDSVVNIIMYHADHAGVQVQKEEGKDGKGKVPPDTFYSENPEDNQTRINEDPLTSGISTTETVDDVPTVIEPTLIQHEWFIDSFYSACLRKEVTPDRTLSPSLASSLDDWITQRLGKKSYLGNKCFYDETIPRMKEKLSEIITRWEFIQISYLGTRLEIPTIPDLQFLVTYREQIFAWVSEQRQKSLDAILAQLDRREQSASSDGYRQ